MRLHLGRCGGALWLIVLGCSGGSGKAPAVDGGGGGGIGGGLADGPPATSEDAATRPPPTPLPDLPAYLGKIVVTPAAVLFTKSGEAAALRAEAFDASGQKMAAATFTWESSRPSDVVVDANGQVVAMAALGSSQIRVRAGGLLSPPVMVLVAEPAAGAVLVSDAQVIAGPTAMDPATAPVVGAKVKLSVTGVPALAPGTVLMSREGKPVAGRVVSAAPGAGGPGQLDVVLETIPLLDLFKRLSVDGSYDVDPAAMAQALAMPPKPTMAPVRLPRDIELRQQAQTRMLGPKLKCEAKVSSGALTGDSTLDLRPQMTFNHRFLKDNDTGQWTELMAKLEGKLTVTGTVSLNFSPMLAATLSCEATIVKIPIPVAGVLSGVLSLEIPLGIKGEITGTIALVPLKAALELKGESKITLGFQYTPQGGTKDLGDFSNKFEMEPSFTVPGGDSPGVALVASAAFGGTAGLNVSVFLGVGTFSLLEAALLLKAEVKSGGIATGLAFATAYDLKPTLEAGPGEDAKKALEWLGGAVALKPMVSVTLPTIAQSPRGKLTADMMKAMPMKPVKLTVDLQPDSLSFLGLHNVVDVRIFRIKREGVGLELVDTISGGPGQTSFTHTWTPTFLDRDGSIVSFFAGVTTKLMPGLALEVSEPSKLDIMVGGMADPRWMGDITTTCTEASMEANGDTFSETVSTTLKLQHETEMDAFMANAKVTGSGMADEKNTHDYTYQELCQIKVHEETIGTAREIQFSLFQTKFHESTGDYVLLGSGNIIGTRRTIKTESGSCKPDASTSSPETRYRVMFGYNITGMVAPGSNSFSGSKTMPGDNAASSCTWTWSFSRVK